MWAGDAIRCKELREKHQIQPAKLHHIITMQELRDD